MGLSGSKSTATTQQTNKPVYSAEIGNAASQLSNTYNQQAPKIAGISDQFLDLSSDLLAKYQQGDPAVNAARGYVTDTLGMDAANNPYLNDMISQTNDSVRNQLQAKLGTRGLTGSSDYYGLIGRELAKNETGLRYNDYNTTMDRKAQAAGLASNVAAADLLTLAPALSTGQMGAMLPMQGALQYAAGTGGLLGGYQTANGTQTQQSNPGLLGILGTGLQAASLFSDERLKTDIRRVGQTDDGLPVYTYRYGGAGPFHMGVMAQEVREAQSEALGPTVAGYMTVDYGKVR